MIQKCFLKLNRKYYFYIIELFYLFIRSDLFMYWVLKSLISKIMESYYQFYGKKTYDDIMSVNSANIIYSIKLIFILNLQHI